MKKLDCYIDKDEILTKRYYFIITRILDLSLSILGLILLSPIFLVIILFIKWDDPKSPVIFKQERVGKDEKTFMMYKFRTMVPNAERELEKYLQYNEIEGAAFKIKQDPRITKVGSFLRKTSLDELPQLWNVIKGEMSLVGPRPPLPREVAMYSEYDKQRLMILPGCTGLWQISGRNELTFNEMIELDLKYVEQLSIKQYLLIIIKTFGVIFSQHGAY